MLFGVFAFAATVAASPLAEFAKRHPVSPGSPAGPYLSPFHPELIKKRSSATLQRTNKVLSLTRKESKSGSRLLRAARAENASCVDGDYGIAELSTTEEGQILITSVQVGDESYEAVVDTGSSDTWVVRTGFQCQNQLGGNETEAYCKFGPSYNTSSTFTPIPDQNFKISYADGEGLTGIMGYEKVTLGGITVYNQTIGVVDTAAWKGDGSTSGLIGLAYPALTSAYNGTNVTADTRASKVEYSPIFTSMYSQGSVESLFTLTLERGNGNSTLALGGLPPAEPGYENLTFTSVDIEIKQLNPGQNSEYKTHNSYYTITPQGFQYRNASLISGILPTRETMNTTYPTIVDSGTSLIYLPQAQVQYINSAFSTPSVYDEEYGYDTIPCNATAPEFGVVIGGNTFPINAEDMILDLGLEDGMCVSGVQNGGGAVNILGDVFLRNVIAVFDVGSAQMHFAPHAYY
ncbi:hypothetical protein AAFC00_000110 [Neodothiora populina]|uniref:Peptidase A1 domain-containing protein n=1 Tax=Neodothiora populina TaxID=2781224 RepID=A0ABR3P1T3_9PEZI